MFQPTPSTEFLDNVIILLLPNLANEGDYYKYDTRNDENVSVDSEVIITSHHPFQLHLNCYMYSESELSEVSHKVLASYFGLSFRNRNHGS